MQESVAVELTGTLPKGKEVALSAGLVQAWVPEHALDLNGPAWSLSVEAFFYAALHFMVYAVVDQGLDLRAILADVGERKFITAGFAALLILTPLAITSTARMRKRLGAVRWQRLHRSVYLAGALASLHFVWRVKKDLTQPLWYAAVLALLLAVRVIYRRPRSHQHS